MLINDRDELSFSLHYFYKAVVQLSGKSLQRRRKIDFAICGFMSDFCTLSFSGWKGVELWSLHLWERRVETGLWNVQHTKTNVTFCKNFSFLWLLFKHLVWIAKCSKYFDSIIITFSVKTACCFVRGNTYLLCLHSFHLSKLNYHSIFYSAKVRRIQAPVEPMFVFNSCSSGFLFFMLKRGGIICRPPQRNFVFHIYHIYERKYIL